MPVVLQYDDVMLSLSTILKNLADKEISVDQALKELEVLLKVGQLIQTSETAKLRSDNIIDLDSGERRCMSLEDIRIAMDETIQKFEKRLLSENEANILMKFWNLYANTYRNSSGSLIVNTPAGEQEVFETSEGTLKSIDEALLIEVNTLAQTHAKTLKELHHAKIQIHAFIDNKEYEWPLEQEKIWQEMVANNQFYRRISKAAKAQELAQENKPPLQARKARR